MDGEREPAPEEREAWEIVERIKRKRDWSKLAKLQFCRDGSRSKQEYDIKCLTLHTLEKKGIIAVRWDKDAKGKSLFVVEDGGKPGDRGRNCLVGWGCEYAFKNSKDAKNYARAYRKFQRKYFQEMGCDSESIVRIVQEKVIEVEKRRL